ncbi:MAG: hypothetical protein KDD64_10135, partial [Bdellovibrionales bacterium]|nr:hypothetical protein [Bdellovibrionales bacterium]
MKQQETVIRPTSSQVLDSSIVYLVESKIARSKIQRRFDTEGQLVSISVPRADLRNAINDKSDPSFRRALRNTNTELQDIEARRRGVSFGDVMSASVYVEDSKSVGLAMKRRRGEVTGKSLETLRYKLEDWAEVKIPAAVLLLILGGTGYGLYRLWEVSSSIVNDYSEILEEAASSPEGLDRALERHS